MEISISLDKALPPCQENAGYATSALCLNENKRLRKAVLILTTKKGRMK
jgi:hypothetical protein